MVPSPQKRRKQSGPVAITDIYSLPDELLLTIIKIAAEDGSTNEETTPCCQYNHNFVANVVSEISVRFNRLARDQTLWRCYRSKNFLIPRSSASINSLPDKIVLKIVDSVSTLSGKDWEERGHSREHGYLVDIISQVNVR